MGRPMRRLASLLVLGPLLMASKCGRQPDDEAVKPKDTLPTPELELQVAGIDPSFMPADAGFAAEVLGNGFEKGAEAKIAGALVDTRFRDSSTLAVNVPALSSGSYDVQVTNPDGTKATLRRALTISSGASAQRCPALTVRFGYDSSVLDASARAEIEGAASCLRNSTESVRVEGHCDERGTTDYNIALGQRRADAVARFLVGLGVGPSRVVWVSYGEERPIAGGTGEAAWATNRRVEILPSGAR
jgi:outer membrane protein OmpA-like peptidoglycan-associated protein